MFKWPIRFSHLNTHCKNTILKTLFLPLLFPQILTTLEKFIQLYKIYYIIKFINKAHYLLYFIIFTEFYELNTILKYFYNFPEESSSHYHSPSPKNLQVVINLMVFVAVINLTVLVALPMLYIKNRWVKQYVAIIFIWDQSCVSQVGAELSM